MPQTAPDCRLDEAAQADDCLLFFDRQGQPMTTRQWLTKRKDPTYRFLDRTRVGDAEVITAWLGTDQEDGLGDRPPAIFGTVARRPGRDQWLDDRERFAATEDEALANHAALVHALEAMQVPAGRP